MKSSYDKQEELKTLEKLKALTYAWRERVLAHELLVTASQWLLHNVKPIYAK